ncbi:MAG: hypothetical protein Q4G24_05200 [Paracoccus sp. (in: a-proteobacteria)]|uniref:hypothetical protein n=1 Tax=Paracoccus sp. TaxID=267 RepID=UPI0026E0599E|nr:hypothetical protein [Paracoccus sp. (in: a-proteobacteria)]MDO5620848.1 hypothetical protein [Paracoccus sp. (in: a-proteobacteria)]
MTDTLFDFPPLDSPHFPMPRTRAVTGEVTPLPKQDWLDALKASLLPLQSEMVEEKRVKLNGKPLIWQRHLVHVTNRNGQLVKMAVQLVRNADPALNSRYAAGEMHLLRFSARTTAEGCHLQAWLNGALLLDYTDPPEVALTGGAPGICAFGEGPDRVELNSFDGGPL